MRDLPPRVWLDVPEVEREDARTAGAQWHADVGAWSVDPRVVERSAVAQWLPPRIGPTAADEALAWMTVYALPHRCRECREESLAVVAYRAVTDGPSPRSTGQVSSLSGADLDLVAAALREARLPRDLASLRRRSSWDPGEVYMSSGCPHCDALFNQLVLGEDYLEGQDIGLDALVEVARVLVPERMVRKRQSVADPQPLTWAPEDWAAGVITPPASQRPDLGQAGQAHQEFGKGEQPPDDDRPFFKQLLGRGPANPEREWLTRGEVRDLLEGKWGDARAREGTTYAFDRITGEIIKGRYRKLAYDVPVTPPSAVAELMLSLRDDQDWLAVRQAVLRAGAVAAHNLEDHALVARVPPEVAGVDVATATRPRSDKTQGGSTVKVPARLVIGFRSQFVPRPSAGPTALEERRFSEVDVHMHLVIPALCWVEDARDATLRPYAADEREMRVQALERDAVFLGDLARRLEKLGYIVDYEDAGPRSVSWSLRGSNPSFGDFLTMLDDPIRHVRRAVAERKGKPPTGKEVLDELRRTREYRTELVRRLDEVQDVSTYREVLASVGVDIGTFERRSDSPPPLPLHVREELLLARVAEILESRSPKPAGAQAVYEAAAVGAAGLGLTYSELSRVAESYLA